MKVLKLIGISFLALLVLAMIISFIPGGEENLKKTNTNLQNTSEQLQEQVKEKQESLSKDTPAYKLAKLEANSSNPSEDLVNRFSKVLTELNDKCTEEDELKIADYIVFSQRKLEEKDVNLSLTEVADGINNSIPQDAIGQEAISCAETATAFVIMTGEE